MPALSVAISDLKTKFSSLSSTVDETGLNVIDGITALSMSVLGLKTKSLTVSFLATNSSFQFGAVVVTAGQLNLMYPSSGILSAGSTLSLTVYKDSVGTRIFNGITLWRSLPWNLDIRLVV